MKDNGDDCSGLCKIWDIQNYYITLLPVAEFTQN